MTTTPHTTHHKDITSKEHTTIYDNKNNPVITTSDKRINILYNIYCKLHNNNTIETFAEHLRYSLEPQHITLITQKTDIPPQLKNLLIDTYNIESERNTNIFHFHETIQYYHTTNHLDKHFGSTLSTNRKWTTNSIINPTHNPKLIVKYLTEAIASAYTHNTHHIITIPIKQYDTTGEYTKEHNILYSILKLPYIKLIYSFHQHDIKYTTYNNPKPHKQLKSPTNIYIIHNPNIKNNINTITNKIRPQIKTLTQAHINTNDQTHIIKHEQIDVNKYLTNYILSIHNKLPAEACDVNISTINKEHNAPKQHKSYELKALLTFQYKKPLYLKLLHVIRTIQNTIKINHKKHQHNRKHHQQTITKQDIINIKKKYKNAIISSLDKNEGNLYAE